MNNKFTEKYILRKLVYYGFALIIFTTAGFGIISEIQADQLLEHADKLINLVFGAGFLMAGHKANAQSDSPAPGRHRVDE